MNFLLLTSEKFKDESFINIKWSKQKIEEFIEKKDNISYSYIDFLKEIKKLFESVENYENNNNNIELMYDDFFFLKTNRHKNMNEETLQYPSLNFFLIKNE